MATGFADTIGGGAMNERQTEALFSDLKEIKTRQEKTYTSVKLTNQKLEQHLEDHPNPALLKQHMEKAANDEKTIRAGFWNIAFRIGWGVLGLAWLGLCYWIATNQ